MILVTREIERLYVRTHNLAFHEFFVRLEIFTYSCGCPMFLCITFMKLLVEKRSLIFRNMLISTRKNKNLYFLLDLMVGNTIIVFSISMN